MSCYLCLSFECFMSICTFCIASPIQFSGLVLLLLTKVLSKDMIWKLRVVIHSFFRNVCITLSRIELTHIQEVKKKLQMQVKTITSGFLPFISSGSLQAAEYHSIVFSVVYLYSYSFFSIIRLQYALVHPLSNFFSLFGQQKEWEMFEIIYGDEVSYYAYMLGFLFWFNFLKGISYF